MKGLRVRNELEYAALLSTGIRTVDRILVGWWAPNELVLISLEQ